MKDPKEQPTRKYGTIQYFKYRIWNSLNERTVNGKYPNWNKPTNVTYYLGKGIRLELSKEELYKWIDDNWPVFLSIMESGEKPSIDRIDSDKNYELSNIQVIPLRKNSKKAGLKTGKDRSIPIIGTCVYSGKEIRFRSAYEASLNGFIQSGIWKALNGVMGSHKGYSWRVDVL